MDPARRAHFRFENTEVDSAHRELRRGAERVSIAPKPFELLLLLLANRHRSVSRVEILERVWHGVHVSDATLASTLRDLRRALGDEGKQSRLIRTLRGVGLRFIAPVEELRLAPEREVGAEQFVGREALLARLHEALAAAARGRGGVAVIAGAPGIGKTRLAEEFARQARSEGAAVYIGRCPESASFSYRPWTQVLRELLDAQPEPLAPELAARAADLARLLPELAGAGAPNAGDSEAESDAALFRLFDATASLVSRAARRAPIALVFDDLDRADRPSLRLLEFAADELAAARVLIVGLYRSSELAGEHPLAETLAELQRHPRLETHRLDGLSRDETRALVRSCAGGDAPPDVVRAIQRRSDGNPFFARALTLHWLNRVQGGSGIPAEQWAREVPESVRELVRGRVLRLSDRCREAVVAAAVLGREFCVEVLARILGVEEEALFDVVEEARRAGLVELSGPFATRFAHALVQEAIYAELAPARRRELHRLAGEALEASGDGGGRYLAEIARHFALGGEPAGPRAVDSAVRAAEEAERRLAFAEGPGLYELALETLERVSPLDRARRCDLLVALARAFLRDRELEQAGRAARRAVELARELESPARLAQAALVLAGARELGSPARLSRPALVLAEQAALRDVDVVALLEESLPGLGAQPTPLRARVLSEMSKQLFYGGQEPRRLRLAEEAVAVARATDDPEALVGALVAQRHALGAPGRLADRLVAISEAVLCADRALQPVWQIGARTWRAADLLESGDLESAERDVAAAERIAAEKHMQRFQSFPLRWRAMRALLEGRFADARLAIDQALAAGRRARDPNALPWHGAQLAALLWEEQRLEELDAFAGEALAWLDPDRAGIPGATAFFALLDAERGRGERAERAFAALASDGFESVERSPDFLVAASFLAELSIRLGDRGAAASLYERLSPYAERVAIVEYALSCRGSVSGYLGMLARWLGRGEEARRHLERAIAANAALGATRFAERSRAELALLATGGETS